MSREIKLDVFADHHRFYLEDEGATFPTDDVWEDRSFPGMIDAGPGGAAVGTAGDFDVPVTVRVLDSKPEENLGGWDHVAGANLEVPSGRLMILGCTEYRPDAMR